MLIRICSRVYDALPLQSNAVRALTWLALIGIQVSHVRARDEGQAGEDRAVVLPRIRHAYCVQELLPRTGAKSRIGRYLGRYFVGEAFQVEDFVGDLRQKN